MDCARSTGKWMDGEMVLGQRELYDNTIIYRIAVQFQTTVQWVLDNLRIVVPFQWFRLTIHRAYPDMPEVRKYLTITDNDVNRQTTWEKDGEINQRIPTDQEIREYYRSNWNSMIDPCSFPPTILHPSAKGWKVQVKIHNVTERGARPVLIHVHPNTNLLGLAKKVETAMGYSGQGDRPRIQLLPYGRIIRSIRYEDETDDLSGTIASCVFQTPVEVIWNRPP